MITVKWGNRLESMADALFELLAENPLGDPLMKECVVLNSPTMESWLKHHFVYERRGKGRQRVLANWDVQYLYVFINDWLFRMSHAAGEKREPKYHPYSKDCLRWRSNRLLGSGLLKKDIFAPLKNYLAQDQAASPRRTFDLAGVLAQLYDDYQIYRPDMLNDWQKDSSAVTGDQAWQRDLWRMLEKDKEKSYLKQFCDIRDNLSKCGIKDVFRRVLVFGISTMPPVYIHFFEQLSEIVEVYFYVFNPCKEKWDEDITPREKEKKAGAPALQGKDDAREYLETGNPLLSSLGKGCQSYLAELIDRTGGQIDDMFESMDDNTVLQVVQKDIRDRRWIKESDQDVINKRDRNIRPGDEIARDVSVQIQICHSPWREVQVLHDHILMWFADDVKLQPRHIQVLVSDMAVYAPYIDAVFSTPLPDRNTDRAIPYAVTDRSIMATNPVASAFLRMLNLPAGRFKASEVMDLVETEAVREAFELDANSVTVLRGWVRASGIRWGMDQEQVKELINDGFDPSATWRSGLDRMLLGSAMGRIEGLVLEGGGLVDAGKLGKVSIFDNIEGSDAGDLGKLLQYFDSLCEVVNEFKKPCSPADWGARLVRLIDKFFVSTNRTYRDVAALRQAVKDFTSTAEVAGVTCKVPQEIVASFMKQNLAETPSGGDLVQNAVVFSALRAMRSTPRRFICLLGMNDGDFPRSDRRPSFDLMAERRLRADRSHRLDDRQAFLEALMSARERLYISYVGRTDRTNEKMPPSTVVSELRDYLVSSLELPQSHKSEDGQELLYCETLHHLQAFHPDYFRAAGRLFSYSDSNCCAARKIASSRESGAEKTTGEQAAISPPSDADKAMQGNNKAASASMATVSLIELQSFFRNPSKYFYNNTLQVRFEEAEDAVLPDSEIFEPGGLDEYKLNEFMFDAVQKNAGRDDILEVLKGRGLAPLGEPGRVDFVDRWSKMQSFLAAKPKALDGRSVRDVLQAQVTKHPFQFPVNNCMLTGHLDLRRGLWEYPVLVFSRYAEMNGKYLIQAWLAHLVACVDIENVNTFVIGQNKDKPVIKKFLPLQKVARQSLLLEYINLFGLGQTQIIPFAPATSYAYEKEYADTGKKDSAIAAAQKEWRTTSHARGDSADPYFFRGFGEEGPMAVRGFADTAGLVFNNLAAQLSQKDKK